MFGGPVADVLPLVEKADGIVFGAPVHYATAAASMLGFMHRLAIQRRAVSAAQAGGQSSPAPAAPAPPPPLEAMEKIPQFFEMPLVSSTYWPMVHGSQRPIRWPLDEEGLPDHAQPGHAIWPGC